MAKYKKKSVSVKKQPANPVKVKKTTKDLNEIEINLKSRFKAYIKTEKETKKRIVQFKEIEGVVYYEFKGMEGVYFNSKMFI